MPYHAYPACPLPFLHDALPISMTFTVGGGGVREGFLPPQPAIRTSAVATATMPTVRDRRYMEGEVMMTTSLTVDRKNEMGRRGKHVYDMAYLCVLCRLSSDTDLRTFLRST